ncbi:MAG: DNA-3-methyladenine glycosylase I [Selenomonadaceae bacterium]|nr:DNA-3-methyladenine glycosylase I [Selenomonadaceae bacterium]
MTLYETLTTTRNALSDAVTRDLKKRGVKFAGTTSIYSFLQAIGIIYSHDPSCFCFTRDGWDKRQEKIV